MYAMKKFGKAPRSRFYIISRRAFLPTEFWIPKLELSVWQHYSFCEEMEQPPHPTSKAVEMKHFSLW